MSRTTTGQLVWIKATDPPDTFPPVAQALREPDGLLAAGGDLQPERLLAAYRRGIFPWYSADQPIMWWSPDPRTVLFPDKLKVSRSLLQSARKQQFVTRMDCNFAAVIAACGDRTLRPEGSWITAEMRAAYQQLHYLGYAHSVETYQGDELVGGLYGVQLGRVFFGESMFSRVTDASKFALKQLCAHLLQQHVAMIDCQMATPHLISLGAQLIPRSEFVELLRLHVGESL